MKNPFSIQNPIFYNHVYGEKNYKLEADMFLDIFREYGSNSLKIFEIGAGTGNLAINLVQFSKNYLCVEPCNQFCEYLDKRLNEFNYVHIENKTIGDFLKINSKATNTNFVIANFNVLNYLTQNDFYVVLENIKKVVDKNTIFIFDTWSLDFVTSNPSEMHNKKVFEIDKKDGLTNFIKLVRYSSSEFNNLNNQLKIKFKFFKKNKSLEEYIGEEEHLIYPYKIEKLKEKVESLGWHFLKVFNYESGLKKVYNQKGLDDFSKIRNWFVFLKLKD